MQEIQFGCDDCVRQNKYENVNLPIFTDKDKDKVINIIENNYIVRIHRGNNCVVCDKNSYHSCLSKYTIHNNGENIDIVNHCYDNNVFEIAICNYSLRKLDYLQKIAKNITIDEFCKSITRESIFHYYTHIHQDHPNHINNIEKHLEKTNYFWKN